MTVNPPTPTRLHLKRDERLEIDWSDGRKCVYTIEYLRSMCPCAMCRTVREGKDPHALMQPAGQKKPLLTILPGNYAKPLSAVSAKLVGNYALQIDWSDEHGSGIYSFEYLREICPASEKAGG
jgi:DUF971 family protein